MFMCIVYTNLKVYFNRNKLCKVMKLLIISRKGLTILIIVHWILV